MYARIHAHAYAMYTPLQVLGKSNCGYGSQVVWFKFENEHRTVKHNQSKHTHVNSDTAWPKAVVGLMQAPLAHLEENAFSCQLGGGWRLGHYDCTTTGINKAIQFSYWCSIRQTFHVVKKRGKLFSANREQSGAIRSAKSFWWSDGRTASCGRRFCSASFQNVSFSARFLYACFALSYYQSRFSPTLMLAHALSLSFALSRVVSNQRAFRRRSRLRRFGGGVWRQ